MTWPRASLAATLFAWLLSVGAASAEIRNLGLASDEVLAGSKMLAFLAGERSNGGRDLNGDGDRNDFVPHVYDREQGETLNLGLSATRLKVDGEVLSFLVSELGEGVDLNGDGDIYDVVPHVFDRRDRSITSLGRHSGLDYFANRHQVVFIDGGFAGPLFVYDTHARELREIGFAGTRFYKAIGRNLVFEVDGWVHVYRTAFDQTIQTNLRVDDIVWEVAIRGGRVAIPVSEARMGGLDYNGDGDTADRVVHLFELSSGRSTNSGVALSAWFGAVPLEAVGDRFLLWVSERDEGGRDLNGDGDADDVVLHRLLANGTVTNLAVGGPALLRTLGPVAAFTVSEWSHGEDLNGDGDAIDRVAYVYDATWDEVVNTGLALGGTFHPHPPVWQRGMVVPVGESAQGGLDLNGDGDVGDTVPHLVEIGVGAGPPSQMRITNTRLALGSWGLYVTRSGDHLVMSVSESGQGETDLDGDGSLHSSVPHSFRVADLSTRNWRLDDRLSRPVSGSGGSVAVLVFERKGDLNRDGDDFDRVVHVGPVWPRRMTRR